MSDQQLAIVIDMHRERRRSPVAACVAGVMIFALAIAFIPALHPLTVRTPRYVYVLSLERRTPARTNDLYPDPELWLGPWRYRLVYWPQIGVGKQ